MGRIQIKVLTTLPLLFLKILVSSMSDNMLKVEV